MEIIGNTYSNIHYEQYASTKDAKMFEDIPNLKVLDSLNLDVKTENAVLNLDDDKKKLSILALLNRDQRALYTDIREMLSRYESIDINYIKELLLKIREYVKVAEVEQRQFGEVMTPTNMVKEMLDVLPKETWNNPNLKFLDPANGVGPYPLMIIYKLMCGLKEWQPNEKLRYKYIIENMIYVCELQPINMHLYSSMVNPYSDLVSNVYTGSYLDEQFDYHKTNVWGIEKFDYVIGNPPYQEEDGGAKASSKPLYNQFIDKSLLITDKLLFITPSRWFAGGKGLDKFRQDMMSSNKFKLIKDFPGDGKEIFGNNVNIGGGVSYFLYDNTYNGLCSFNDVNVNLNKYDVIIRDTVSYKLIDKLIGKYNTLEDMAFSRSYYEIQTNDSRLTDGKISDEQVACYVSQKKGFIKYIDKSFIKPKYNIDIHKVATPRALGKPENGLGNVFYVDNNSVVSDTYIFLNVKNKKEADSLISYMNTQFVHYLVCLRKIDSAIKPSTLKWIPQVPLDRIWNDNRVFDYFNITPEEKMMINKNMKKTKKP